MREPWASSAMQGNIRLEFALAQCIAVRGGLREE